MINALVIELLLFLHQNATHMADNYLEKKMEEYRSGALSKPAARRLSPTGERPGTVSFRIDQLRVLVTDASDDVGRAVVRKLRGAGCRVAFVSPDIKDGRTLSQATGSRFYPVPVAHDIMADITEAWGGLDALVVIGGDIPSDIPTGGLRRIIILADTPSIPDIAAGDNLTVNAISTRNISAGNAAHRCLFLCLNDSDFIDRRVIM